MHERHLLGVLSSGELLHLAEDQTTGSSGSTAHYNTILGLQPHAFYLLVGIAVVALSILLTIFIIYRRYRTRQDYNQNPEQFPHLPDLSFIERRHLKNMDLDVLLCPEALTIEKNTQDYQGPYFKVTYKGSTPAAVYFKHEQTAETYFEIEVLELATEVEIGFMHVDSETKVQEKEEEVGYIGVSLSSSGFVVANGQNVYNYNWSLNYGDVIGLGITIQSEKFNERRVWVSKNGVLLNSPPANQMDKWLATVEISAEEREKFNIVKDKEATQDVNKDAEVLDKAAEAAKQAQEREQNMLQNQRINLKTFKEPRYYPVVYFPGNKQKQKAENTEGVMTKKKTSVNLNVGGQIFRMQEAFFKSGLLK